jgi:hypothetical protein
MRCYPNYFAIQELRRRRVGDVSPRLTTFLSIILAVAATAPSLFGGVPTARADSSTASRAGTPASEHLFIQEPRLIDDFRSFQVAYAKAESLGLLGLLDPSYDPAAEAFWPDTTFYVYSAAEGNFTRYQGAAYFRHGNTDRGEIEVRNMFGWVSLGGELERLSWKNGFEGNTVLALTCNPKGGTLGQEPQYAAVIYPSSTIYMNGTLMQDGAEMARLTPQQLDAVRKVIQAAHQLNQWAPADSSYPFDPALPRVIAFEWMWHNSNRSDVAESLGLTWAPVRKSGTPEMRRPLPVYSHPRSSPAITDTTIGTVEHSSAEAWQPLSAAINALTAAPSEETLRDVVVQYYRMIFPKNPESTEELSQWSRNDLIDLFSPQITHYLEVNGYPVSDATIAAVKHLAFSGMLVVETAIPAAAIAEFTTFCGQYGARDGFWAIYEQYLKTLQAAGPAFDISVNLARAHEAVAAGNQTRIERIVEEVVRFLKHYGWELQYQRVIIEEGQLDVKGISIERVEVPEAKPDALPQGAIALAGPDSARSSSIKIDISANPAIQRQLAAFDTVIVTYDDSTRKVLPDSTQTLPDSAKVDGRHHRPYQ